MIDLDVNNRSTLDTLVILNETVFDKYRFATITFEKDYLFYGIGNILQEYSSNITKYYSIESLEEIILTIVPDIIIHLAGISNSNLALQNPIETINTNGLMAVNICDILYRNKLKTKLFNASSSEIYKQKYLKYKLKYMKLKNL